MRWNEGNCRNWIHSSEIRRALLSAKPQLQFCAQVFSAGIEFQELTHEEHKLDVLYYTMIETNLKTPFQKEMARLKVKISH